MYDGTITGEEFVNEVAALDTEAADIIQTYLDDFVFDNVALILKQEIETLEQQAALEYSTQVSAIDNEAMSLMIMANQALEPAFPG